MSSEHCLDGAHLIVLLTQEINNRSHHVKLLSEAGGKDDHPTPFPAVARYKPAASITDRKEQL